MAVRFAYTQYKRSWVAALPLASNALPYDIVVGDTSQLRKNTIAIHETTKSPLSESLLSTSKSLDKVDGISQAHEFDEKVLETGSVVATPQLSKPVAIFPQYLTTEVTNITIREVDLPRFPNSFAVLTASGDTLFHVDRERPSFSSRQCIIDAATNEIVMTIRHDIGTLPKSYKFVDNNDTKVLDLQGNFFLPALGARATSLFTNAVDGSNVRLLMQGSWRNRRAAIKNIATREVLATMESGLLNFRTFAGYRRTYYVTVSKGVDLAVITGMIVALDARSS